MRFVVPYVHETHRLETCRGSVDVDVSPSRVTTPEPRCNVCGAVVEDEHVNDVEEMALYAYDDYLRNSR